MYVPMNIKFVINIPWEHDSCCLCGHFTKTTPFTVSFIITKTRAIHTVTQAQNLHIWATLFHPGLSQCNEQHSSPLWGLRNAWLWNWNKFN